LNWENALSFAFVRRYRIFGSMS